jgi:hypothetical protein
MENTICLTKSQLGVLLFIFIGITILSNYKNKDSDYLLNKIANSISDLQTTTQVAKTNNDTITHIIDPELEKRIMLTNRDQNVLLNDFTPPERRVPSHAYPNSVIKQQFNIPTRGIPDNYQLLGIVMRDNTETAYNLFGRQTFPGSNQYEYYVQGNLDRNIVKIPITINGDREIEDGQIITIPGTSALKGNFQVKLYKLDVPRYNPMIL